MLLRMNLAFRIALMFVAAGVPDLAPAALAPEQLKLLPPPANRPASFSQDTAIGFRAEGVWGLIANLVLKSPCHEFEVYCCLEHPTRRWHRGTEPESHFQTG